MRKLCVLLALILALQPSLVVVISQDCGEVECSAFGSVAVDSSCCGCCAPAADEVCCCAEPSDDGPPPPAPAPSTESTSELLYSYLVPTTQGAVTIRAEANDSLLQLAEPTAPLSSCLTHNERLSIHCVSRT